MSNQNNETQIPVITIPVIDLNNPDIQKKLKELKNAKRPHKPSFILQLKDIVLYEQKLCEYQIDVVLWNIANDTKHTGSWKAYLKVIGAGLLAVGTGVGIAKSFNKNEDTTELIPETTDNDVIE